MSSAQWHSRAVPAQLSFLAIYNPGLSHSEETFRDQLVFHYSRVAQEARIAARKHARYDAAGGDALRADENEKLRQIGLAQGMVDFAKTFSNGKSVDSIETEKSRIVLHELEKGWWILASIDLTRLHTMSYLPKGQGKDSADTSEPEPTIEYSAREIGLPALLIQQLVQGHQIFCLHHGPSLTELWIRLSREKFCTTLDRFWTRFARSWDVLLHGNPAADIFNGIKLASGGELGFGVGEEEWGSGEREVLEDLISRTEGLADLVVTRFGNSESVGDDNTGIAQDDIVPWIGAGKEPEASDGLIFGGIGGIQRESLRAVSLWMRQIYTYGEQAYGVKDNPQRERRKRKRWHPIEDMEGVEVDRQEGAAPSQSSSKIGAGQSETTPQTPGDTRRNKNQDRSETETQEPVAVNGTTTDTTHSVRSGDMPGIPPPIISGAAKTDLVSEQKASGAENDAESGSMFGISDTYMKYLTFGLSTLAKPKRPESVRQSSVASNTPADPQDDGRNASATRRRSEMSRETATGIAHLDPIPDGESRRAKIMRQKRQESRGYFIIGLKGDLQELDELSEDDLTDGTDDSLANETKGPRIVLRTVQVELALKKTKSDDASSETPQNETDAEAENDTINQFKRLRVLIYVHRPFMYCFLFEDRTSSLQLTKFYKSLHRNLVPIHKPLLSSTNPVKIADRIAASQTERVEDDAASILSEGGKSKSPANKSPIYDLIFDPQRLTLHTSIPNIPEPGTLAAEGIYTSKNTDTRIPTDWTRIEALNVHSQILNTCASVAHAPSELERTSKTTRGWWIIWLRIGPSPIVPTSDDEEQESAQARSASGMASSRVVSTVRKGAQEEENMDRIAFLVRKAGDAAPAPAPSIPGSRAVSSMLEVMSLGMSSREDESTGGVSAGWGPGALAGGIGIDARKYAEGLLSLNR